jgi:CSLREA domain-containing protein
MIRSSIAVTARVGKALLLGLLAATFVAASPPVSEPAHAAKTFTVDNTLDPGDGNCSATLGCTLREAINAANATPGEDLIRFNIQNSGVQTIKPTSKLPVVTEAVIIDGYTQSGAVFNGLAKGTNAKLLIELDGSNLGASDDGLKIQAPNTVVRGLVINRFGDTGIQVSSSPFTDVTNVRVEGNFIGTDPSGTIDRGNGGNGVGVERADVAVGNAPIISRNLISGNGGDGVFILGDSTVGVQGNLIGTKGNGTSALGNADDGVGISNADNNVVGAGSTELQNVVAFNGDNGVEVVGSASSGNRVEQNSIFSNSELGIDLGNDGPTANDPMDPDTGPNSLQNKPTLVSAVTSAGKTTVRGKLNSEPGRQFALLLYRNPGGNEGKIFLGPAFMTTGAKGNASFEVTPARAVPTGQMITATATNGVEGTSEFSAPRKVVAP